ncbi:MAG: DNA-directed RNA polymerase subunit alpha [Candidatus Brennerbacteria bacterium]|nr:DNA-directed RNA polymerase subunit alpha [Candidatus Brennerbacteria bacterium]
MKITHLSDTVEIKKVSEDSRKGVFNIEGLYSGYGLTLGNALRRVLLSSLPGAAITQIKIKGVHHEFSTLPGMMEDIVSFTLNLKKARFAFFAEEPQVLTLKVKGEKKVTAGDIAGNASVSVANPDLHLASLTDKKAELDIEITVEKGLGYLPADSRKTERLSVGTIVLDALFSPVVNVNFHIENMRVGERTDYNRLIVDIETDGTLSPSAALHKAANVLSDHFQKVSAIEVIQTEEPVRPALKEEKKKTKKK